MKTIDPNLFLKVAKHKAEIHGYDPNLLELATDGKHKLMWNKIKFGSYGMGDFIQYLYQYFNGEITKEEALQHRKNYLARATKIRGDWKSKKDSKNNLAISILW